MYTHLILRYGELFLKGNNQGFFEEKLMNNVAALLPPLEVRRLRGRLLLPYFPDHKLIRRIFGISSYSPALFVKKELSDIIEGAGALLQHKKGTFRVETKRSDKRFFLLSPDVNRTVGMALEKKGLRCDLTLPDFVLYIEINEAGAYLFTEIISGAGGLPVGVEGKVAVFIEDEASILAGLLMMKRGCQIVPLATSAQEISLLQQYSPKKLSLQLSSKEEIFSQKLLVRGVWWEHFTQIKSEGVVLYPLIAYNSEEIALQLATFSD